MKLNPQRITEETLTLSAARSLRGQIEVSSEWQEKKKLYLFYIFHPKEKLNLLGKDCFWRKSKKKKT